jgi:hypothetical protein
LLTLLGYVPSYYPSFPPSPSPPKKTVHERNTSLTQHHSFFPGHIHAFYIEYVYVKRRDEIRAGIYDATPAPGVYSQKVLNGGHRSIPVAPVGVVAPEQGYAAPPSAVGQQGYGTVH